MTDPSPSRGRTAPRGLRLRFTYEVSPGISGARLWRGAFLRTVPARLAFCIAFLPLLAPAMARGADNASEKNYQTKVDALKPAVHGLQVTTQGGDRYLAVRNDTGKTVAIQGYDGEPYLRLLPSGKVLANANSPAKYLNAIRL